MPAMRMVSLLTALSLGWGAGMALAQDRPPYLAPGVGSDCASPEVPPAQSLCPSSSGCAGERFWAEADYLIYWFKPVCLTVPTISVGSYRDLQPGVFGQPNTQLAQGGHKFEFDGANGVRSRLGAWLTAEPLLGIEAEGFVLEQMAAGSPVVTSNGSPATFLVFQTPDNTNAALPFTIPGVVTGGSSAVGTSRLWGLEANLAAHVTVECGAWTLQATGLAGGRYLQLDDRVVVTNRQALVQDPSVVASGEANFATRNQFVGGQVGSRLGLARGPLALDLTTKLAFGETHLVSSIAGGPLLTGASVLPPLVPGPLLALPSNVGRSASDRITVVPEFNLRLRWQAGDHAYLTLGYNLLYWNKILCPGDQMDPHVNPSELPFRGPVVGPAAPDHKFVFTDAFAHGLEAGLGFSF
jgi:hypothetical protein